MADNVKTETGAPVAIAEAEPALATAAASSSSPTTTETEQEIAPTPTSTAPDTSRLEEEDTFYVGALKRTGTLYSGAKEGMLKRSGTVTDAVSGGLKRTGTLLGDAKDGIVYRTAGIRDTAGQGLQRTGTVLEEYRQGIVKRTGTINFGTIDAKAGLQRTGTILVSAGAGAVQRANSFGAWAQDYAKGIYDPDRPFKATFQEIAGFALPRAGHSLSVINGRAYIFGGEDETGSMADNHVHVIILPSGGVLEADYKSIAPRSQQKDGEVPAARKGHTAVIVADEIYIFGGQLSDKAKEETAGRVWVFDTISSKWTFHDPKADAPYPPFRTQHAAVASDIPGPIHSSVDAMDLQRQYLNPSIITPEPSPSDSWGTLFIYGGVDPTNNETILNDAWAFDICHRSWFPLPPPPAPARPGASLVLVDDTHLYRIGGRTDPDHFLEADYLDISELLKTPFKERRSLPSLLSEWTSTPLSAPLLGPTIRLVDPGDGRSISLSVQPGAKTITAVDLSLSGGMMILAGTSEIEEGAEFRAPKQVEAVQSQYADLYGEVVRGSMVGMRTFAQVSGYAIEKGTEVDEASLIVWGGKDAEGKVVGTGWMIKVEQ
jgi:hypothetical protein